MKKHLLLLLLALAPAWLRAQCDLSVTTAAGTTGTNYGVDFTLQNSATPGLNQFNYYLVNYGDGSGGNATAATATILHHDYAASGSYPFWVILYLEQYNDPMDSSNITYVCTDTLYDTVVVAPSPCETSISHAVTSAPNTLPVLVEFTAIPLSGTGVGATYSWNFGDGSTGLGVSPVHIYTAIGTFTACLTVTSAGGCTYTTCVPITVSAPCTPCAGLQAGFVSSVNNSGVTFNSTSVTAGTTLYSWDFGDGNDTSSTWAANVYHQYSATGTYSVTLITQSQVSCNGAVYTCSDTFSQSVTIVSTDPPVTQCDLSVTATPATASSDYGIDFTLQNNGTITPNQYNEFDIDYGDGVSASVIATGPVVLHHDYAAPGSYPIWVIMNLLQYNDPMDSSIISWVCSDTLYDTVIVQPSPCASSISYDINSAPGTLPLVADFTATPVAGMSATYSWNFGDATPNVSGMNPTHTFSMPGIYTVCLSTTSAGGCSFTTCIPVTVYEPCTPCAGLNADFTADVNNGAVTFTSTSTTSSNTLYHWDFGDGNAASSVWSATEYNLYSSAGTYHVTLVIQNQDTCGGSIYSCSDTITQTITIITPGYPVADLYGNVINPDSLAYPNAQYKVYLIKHNPNLNLLTAVDSVLTTGGLYTQHYNFPNAGTVVDTFLVKAQWINTTGAASGPVPTYHWSSLYWSGASGCTPNAGSWQSNDIYMQLGPSPTTGPGFIGGDIALGANKGTDAGVPNVLVLLRDATGQPVQFTFTDADGNYAFSNVPEGTYSIYPENLNYATIPATSVTVSTGATTMTDVDFNQDNAQMNIAPRPLGIGQTKAAQLAVAAYPNPANQALTIRVLPGQVGSGARYELTAPNGQIILRGAISAAGQATLSTRALAEGIYFLRAAGSAGQGTTRVEVLHR